MSLKAIAKACGLSVNTVSRIVNLGEREQFRQETVEKVLATARQLHYTPRTEHTRAGSNARLIAFAASGRDDLGRIRHNNWAFPFVSGMSHHLIPLGYHVVMLDLSELTHFAHTGSLPEGIAGIVLQGEIPAEAQRWLQSRHLPVLYWDCEGPDDRFLIQRDEYTVGHTITSMLIKMGHRRIAMHFGTESQLAEVEGGRAPWYNRRRNQGYVDALAEAGLTPHRICGCQWETLAAMTGRDGLSAIVTSGSNSNFHSAMFRLAAETHRRIPADLTLADMTIEVNHWMADTPLIGGFTYDRGEMGQRAAEMLLAQIQDPDRTPPQVLVPSAFVMGDTIDTPPERLAERGGLAQGAKQ